MKNVLLAATITFASACAIDGIPDDLEDEEVGGDDLGDEDLGDAPIGGLDDEDLGEEILALEASGSFDTSAESRTLKRHNRHRANTHPAPRLDRVSCMNGIARDWARNMARNGLRHNPNLGSQLDNRCGSGWSIAAENICRARNARVCWRLWLDSASHHDNIDRNGFRKVGIGAYRVDADTLFVSVIFKD